MSDFKHFMRLSSEERANSPRLFFGIRLDLRDVRSGFYTSDSGCYSGPWVNPELPDIDYSWARNRVFPVKLEELKEIEPPADLAWPERADSLIIRYFATYRRPLIWKNPLLSLYSQSGESREEFADRCMAAVEEEKNRGIGQIRDVFLRRFLEMEQRKIDSILEEEWNEGHEDRRIQEIRRAYSGIREAFSRCFLRSDLMTISRGDIGWPVSKDVEHEERLESLRSEFVEHYNAVVSVLASRVDMIEEYRVPVAEDAVEISTRGFIWD